MTLVGVLPAVSLPAAGIDNTIVGLVSSSRREKNELGGREDARGQDESPSRESDWVRLRQ